MKKFALVVGFVLICSAPVFAKKSTPVRGPAAAASELKVAPCDSNTVRDVEYLVESKTFSKGAVRLYQMDTYGEPVCCSGHLIVMIPDKKAEIGGVKCFEVQALRGGYAGGFLGTNLSRAAAKYDPKTGLSINLVFSLYNDEGPGRQVPATLVVNQAAETVVLK